MEEQMDNHFFHKLKKAISRTNYMLYEKVKNKKTLKDFQSQRILEICLSKLTQDFDRIKVCLDITVNKLKKILRSNN